MRFRLRPTLRLVRCVAVVIILLLQSLPMQVAAQDPIIGVSNASLAGRAEQHALPPRRPMREFELLDFASDVIALTNQERAANGLPPLTFNSALGRSALRHSNDLANNDFFSHTGSDGSEPEERIWEAGYRYAVCGENIAAGYSSPAAVVAAWMSSPGHRANMLQSCFREVGVAYVYEADDTYPGETWGYRHYWTMNLGATVYSCPTPGPTYTPTRTRTPTGSVVVPPTATPTATLTRTATGTSTRTMTRTATPTQTSPLSPTATCTPLHTATRTLTSSSTMTRTATRTPTSQVSPTLTGTPLNTTTRTRTVTRTMTRTATRTATNMATSTATHSRTPTTTAMPSATPNSTASRTPSATVPPSSTPTATASDTLPPSPTRSATPSRSCTPSVTATTTGTATQTATETATRTATRTGTATPTETVMPTMTGTATVTMTATSTTTHTATATMTRTPSPTPSRTLAAGENAYHLNILTRHQETDGPVPGAAIEIYRWQRGVWVLLSVLTTDEQGQATFDYTGPDERFAVRERDPEGYTSVSAGAALWGASQGADMVILEMPSGEATTTVSFWDSRPVPTPTKTLSLTRTATRVATPTASKTASCTPSPTATKTWTPTATFTALPSTTATATASPTGTATATPTVTRTQTVTALPTASRTPTAIPLKPLQSANLRQGVAGYGGAADSYLDAWDATRNRVEDRLVVVRSGNLRSGLLRFELTPLPANAQIESATLRLHISEQSNTIPMLLELYRLRRRWDPALVSWNRASASDNWGLPGANDTESDRDGLPLAQGTLSEVNVWVELAVTELVRGWVAHPAGNYGVLLRGNCGSAVEYRLTSSDYANENLRPQLVIRYRMP